jgi:hypothetical protein
VVYLDCDLETSTMSRPRPTRGCGIIKKYMQISYALEMNLNLILTSLKPSVRYVARDKTRSNDWTNKEARS